MARPQIPDVIKERIEDIHERHRGYSPNSFQEALGTVADLAEREVHETNVEGQLPFEFQVEDDEGQVLLLLSPEPESDLEMTSEGLDTSKALVESDKISASLNEIDGVYDVFPQRTQINVVLDKESERSHEEVVAEVFETLAEIIQRGEHQISQIEQYAQQYASPKESDDE